MKEVAGRLLFLRLLEFDTEDGGVLSKPDGGRAIMVIRAGGRVENDTIRAQKTNAHELRETRSSCAAPSDTIILHGSNIRDWNVCHHTEAGGR